MHRQWLAKEVATDKRLSVAGDATWILCLHAVPPSHATTSYGCTGATKGLAKRIMEGPSGPDTTTCQLLLQIEGKGLHGSRLQALYPRSVSESTDSPCTEPKQARHKRLLLSP